MSQTIRLYDTMRREKVEFVPRVAGKASVYSCGPTVYSEPHIGNFRAFFVADLLRSTLREIGGYEVTQVMNITDVGHLTDDGDQGEDKMEKGARQEGLSVREIARKYETNFLHYMGLLGIDPFDHYPRATEHILEQIAMVEQLIDKGYTYEMAGDGIYMDTSRVADYGKLAKLDIAGLQAGARVDATGKRHPTDFALWKFAPRDEQRQMEWIFSGDRKGTLLDDETRASLTEQEDRTRGFPGRHIECSAMSIRYLGEQFDIHTGGIDHIPVHHTNEIAQAECALGIDQRVSIWMHVQFLQMKGAKLSKSKGDDLSLPALEHQGYSPLDLRYFYLTAQYRSFLDFTRAALQAAQTARAHLIKKLREVTLHALAEHQPGTLYEQCAAAMADDLDTVQVLALYHQGATGELSDQLDILLFDEQITKLRLYEQIEKLQTAPRVSVPREIVSLAEQRQQAKDAKQFEQADRLREQIAEAGWTIRDGAEGFELLPTE